MILLSPHLYVTVQVDIKFRKTFPSKVDSVYVKIALIIQLKLFEWMNAFNENWTLEFLLHNVLPGDKSILFVFVIRNIHSPKYAFSILFYTQLVQSLVRNFQGGWRESFIKIMSREKWCLFLTFEFSLAILECVLLFPFILHIWRLYRPTCAIILSLAIVSTDIGNQIIKHLAFIFPGVYTATTSIKSLKIQVPH